MAASYPGALKTFTDVVDGTTKLVALLFNVAYDEIEAIEIELGTDVAGSLTDLKTRLAVSLNDDGTIKAVIGESNLASSAVSQAKLKSSNTEQYHEQSTTGTSTAAKAFNTYGFAYSTKCVQETGTSAGNFADYTYSRKDSNSSTYGVTMTIEVTNDGTDGWVQGYLNQIYVTASGKDHFIFLLVDKETKRPIGGYSSSDHPCVHAKKSIHVYTHPFLNFNPIKHEIILVDNDILTEAKEKITAQKSLLQVIANDYEIDFDSTPEYEERESVQIDEYDDIPGEVIKEIKTPGWAKIKIQKDTVKLKRQVLKTLPEFIKYKKMKLKGE